MRKSIVVLLLVSIMSGAAIAGDITATGWDQKDVVAWMTEVNSRLNAITKGSVTLSGALAIGTDNTTFQTTATVTGVVNGVVFTKAATDNIAFSGTDNLAISTFTKVLVTVNASGTVATVTGNQATTSALALLPAAASGYIPIGYVEIACDATHTFLLGTSDLGGTGITDTYANFIGPVMGGETAEIGLTNW